MRTSTKLLSGALLILLAVIMIYNLQLRSIYRSGKYKKQDYKEISIKDFSEIEINGASMLVVRFKQGPFNIRFQNQNSPKDSVIFTKVGDRLIISLDLVKNPFKTDTIISKKGKGTTMYYSNTETDPRINNFVTITCPQIKLLKTTDAFLVNGKALSNKEYEHERYFYWLNLELSNFKLDDVSITHQSHCSIVLNNDTIRNLVVNTYDHATIDIDKSNTIQKANLQINGGEFKLDNIIPELTYHIADNAKITLSGDILKNFIKH